MNNNPIMIQAIDLNKQYASGFQAISDINFECRQGEVVGFLGPNGAGKTTTMRILTGYMPPTSGTATIAGFDTMKESLKARERLGYLPETVPLYPEMSVENYLAFAGKIRKLDNLWDRIDDVLESVDMLDRAESFISTLSKGMRQRVGLAAALLHDPDVLILDEPTIGLDPAQIREVRSLITELGKRHTILLSTHILTEVEQICTRAIMVIGGKMVADMPLQQDGDGRTGNVTLRVARADAGIADALTAIPNIHTVTMNNDNEYVLNISEDKATRQNIAAVAVENGWGLLELKSARTSLEAVFMEKLRGAEAAEEEE